MNVTQKCSTIGCQKRATHEVTWDRGDGKKITESVCREDGMMYTYRPSLKATLRELRAGE